MQLEDIFGYLIGLVLLFSGLFGFLAYSIPGHW